MTELRCKINILLLWRVNSLSPGHTLKRALRLMVYLLSVRNRPHQTFSPTFFWWPTVGKLKKIKLNSPWVWSWVRLTGIDTTTFFSLNYTVNQSDTRWPKWWYYIYSTKWKLTNYCRRSFRVTGLACESEQVNKTFSFTACESSSVELSSSIIW